jgi:FAD:protein FMN transferase
VSTASARWQALGTTVEVTVSDPGALPTARTLLAGVLTAVDVACSRFRPDSELAQLHRRRGREVAVGPVLTEALRVALRAAALTDGLVDPTVGDAVLALGYDRDFADVDPDSPSPATSSGPAPGWWQIRFDAAGGRVLLPRGVRLDLGATAKALAADRAADRIFLATGCGVLVNLGGDLATAGPAPADGWRIAVGDDHTRSQPGDPVVQVASGGLATSSTTRRRWRRAGRELHHIVDPRTGDVPESRWRTVTVAAANCVDANTASTAAIVLGDAAGAWLGERSLPARLVAADGTVRTVGDWPATTVAVGA